MTHTKHNNTNDPQKKHRIGTVSKSIYTGGLELDVWYQVHPYFWCGLGQIDACFEWKIPNVSMYHIVVNTHWGIKRRQNKDKDSTVYTTEYRSKRNPTVKPQWAQLQTQHKVLTLSSIDKSLSQNSYSLRRVIKVDNCYWVDQRACSLLQYINALTNYVIMRNYFNKLRWKLLEPTFVFDLYTTSPYNTCSESPWHKSDLSP